MPIALFALQAHYNISAARGAMIWADMLRIGNLAVKIGFYLTMKVTKIGVLGGARERAAVHGGGQFEVRERATVRGWMWREGGKWCTGEGNLGDGRGQRRGVLGHGDVQRWGAGQRGRQKNNAAAAREWATTAVWAVSMLQLYSK